MLPASAARGEADRLKCLRTYGLEGLAGQQALNDLASLAARLTGCRFALVNLVDAEFTRPQAAHGLACSPIPRGDTMCALAIANPRQPLIIPDLTQDARFAHTQAVSGEPGLRAYMGVPLVSLEGHALGTLCVLDTVTREFDPESVEALTVLARAAMTTFELHRALQEAHAAAMTDALTGLLNRRASLAAATEAVAAGTAVAGIAIDLDFFKAINDGEGHAAGDAVLRAAADRLRRAVRPGDVVGRLGGDEFIVLLLGLADRAIVSGVAERISAALHRPVEHGGKQIRTGGTIGIALCPADAPDGPGMMSLADQALIRSKRLRRGSVSFAAAEDAAKLAKAALIARAFDPATGADGVTGAEAVFQPALSLDAAGAVLAVEALARWSDPALAELAPEEVFGVLEPAAAAALGAAVRERALASFASLRGAGAGHVRLAFNLSASEVLGPLTGAEVAAQVAAAGLSLGQIDIEFREEVLGERVGNAALDQLAALRGRGARLLLDNFGAASCGMAQVLRLPLDGLKLDRSIVGRLGQDARAEEIARASISLAHGLGLFVVATGIETEPQAAILRALGCDVAQGFLFAPPMPLAGLLRWLEARGAAGVTRLRSRAG